MNPHAGLKSPDRHPPRNYSCKVAKNSYYRKDLPSRVKQRQEGKHQAKRVITFEIIGGACVLCEKPVLPRAQEMQPRGFIASPIQRPNFSSLVPWLSPNRTCNQSDCFHNFNINRQIENPASAFLLSVVDLQYIQTAGWDDKRMFLRKIRSYVHCSSFICIVFQSLLIHYSYVLHCLFQNRILRDSQRAPFNIKALKQSNQATDYFNYNRCTHLFPQKNGKNAKEILKNVENEIYKILKSPLSFQK